MTAVNRPLLSVPYLLNYGSPFTLSGVLTTVHVSKNFNLYNGVFDGWDRQFDSRYTWSYIGGFSTTSADLRTALAFTFLTGPDQFPRFIGRDQNPYRSVVLQPPARFLNQRNPGYNSNDRLLFSTVLSHKWTNRLTQIVEADLAWETNVPFARGDTGTFNRQNAQWYGFANWFLYAINDKVTGVWRSEIFRDNNGVRTGFAANFAEFTLGAIYKPRKNIWIRPETRYDFANGAHPYNDATRSSQLTLAFDVIFLF